MAEPKKQILGFKKYDCLPGTTPLRVAHPFAFVPSLPKAPSNVLVELGPSDLYIYVHWFDHIPRLGCDCSACFFKGANPLKATVPGQVPSFISSHMLLSIILRENLTMATMLDCRIEVRQWVLISSPSRWGQKGQRVTAYSPMFPIPNDVSHVPVKRCSKDEEDSVCFLPKTDIEKDSSKIYRKMRINPKPLFVDAHGVAIVDGLEDGFKFSRGDKFWIYIGSNTKHYNMAGMVPVINLTSGTFEEGSISAEHVCVRTIDSLTSCS